MMLAGNPDFKDVREAQSFSAGGDFASASAQGDLVLFGDVFYCPT